MDKSAALPRALRTAGLRFKADRLPNGTWSLDLSGQTLRDLAPLQGQPIGALTLNGTGVADLEPLRGLPLESLKLAGCPVADLTPLANAPLKLLWMDEAVTATDFSPLATLTALESVLLPPQAIEIEGLSKLPKLQRMSYAAAPNGEPVCTAEDFWKQWDGLGWLRALREQKVEHKAAQLADGRWDVTVRDKRFQDCTIFKDARGVYRLILGDTQVADVSPLSKLPIVELELRNTKIIDLSALRGMTLKSINLGDTAVADLEPLRGMALSWLEIGGTKVADLRPLTGMPLVWLGMNNSRVTDISVLRGMPLTKVRLQKCAQLTDLSPLAEAKELTNLTLPPNAKGIEFLRTLPKLTRLSFAEDKKDASLPDKTAEEFWKEYDQPWLRALRDSGVAIKGVKSLPDGTWDLDLSDAKDFSDLTPLKGTPISKLALDRTAITDLIPLRGMALTRLGLDGTKVSDLGPLEGLPIDCLFLGRTAITDLESLRGMPLKILQIYNTQVTDLNPLKGMPLEELWLAKASDLSALRGMPLRSLKLHDCPRQIDLSPLAEITELTTLTLPTNAQNIDFLRAFPKLERISYKEDWKNGGRPDKTAAEFWKEHDQPWLRALRESGVAIKGVKSLPDGTWDLDLSDAKDFSDLTPLKGAPISSLNLGKTSVSDLAPLRGLPLKALNLDGAPVADIRPIEELPLEILVLQATRLTDLNVLRSPALSGSLHSLNISNLGVLDLSPVAACTQLENLDAHGILATDLAFARGLKLTGIGLVRARVTDISALAGMPLSNVRAEGSATADISPLLQCPTLKSLTLPATAKNVSALRALPDLEKISYDFKEGSGPAQTAAEFWQEYDEQVWLRVLRESGTRMKSVKQLPDGTWELDLSEAKDFSDLTPLKGAPISRLNLTKTGVSDLAPLRGMALKALTLASTAVTDLSPLQGMPIEDLRVKSTKVADLSVLRGMPINRLDLGGTAVADLAPLRGMAIQWLWLNNTKVADLRPLEGMPLTELNLNAIKVTDLSPLRGMPLTNLRFLDCAALTDLSPLAEARELTLLTLPPNAKDIEFLRTFPKLERISFNDDSKNGYRPDRTAAEFWKEYDQPWRKGLREAGITMKAVKPLPDGTWEVDLSEEKLSDLTLLKSAPITSLNLSKTAITDLAPLRGLPLKTLKLDRTAVTDLTPLEGMPLDDLNLVSTKVTDLATLRGMPLTKLDLGNTAVADLAPLRGLPLKTLKFYNTKITALRPLEGMPLDFLHLSGTKVTDLSVLRGMALTSLWLHGCTELTDLSPLADASALTTLTLPPKAANLEFLRALPKLKRLSFTETTSGVREPDRTAAEFWKAYDGPDGLPALLKANVAITTSKPLPAAPAQPAPAANTAEALSRAGKFAEAARLSRERLERAAKDDTAEWMTCAAVLLAAGDRDGYCSACAEAITRFKDTAVADEAERIAKACLLAPDSGVDPAALAALLATAQKTNSHWTDLVSALAEYRAGHWDAAAGWAAKMLANPECPARGTAAANAILAMAEHQRAHPVEARAALAAAKQSVAANWPQGGEGPWFAWLIADLLAKEAAALIK